MRRAALIGLAAAVSGCGFRPLYLPEGGRGGVADAELAAISVPPMSERSGQLMRQALQRRFEGAGTGTAKRYELTASLVIDSDQIGTQQTDSSITRVRYRGSVNWTLRRLDVAHSIVTTGVARVIDGLNIINGQYFAVTLEAEAIQRRIAESLADQVTTQIAIFLKRQAANRPA